MEKKSFLGRLINKIKSAKRIYELKKLLKNQRESLNEKQQFDLLALEDDEHRLLKEYISHTWSYVSPKLIKKLMEMPDREAWVGILLLSGKVYEVMVKEMFRDPVYKDHLEYYLQHNGFVSRENAFALLKHPAVDEFLDLWLACGKRDGMPDEALNYLLALEDKERAKKLILKIGYNNFVYPTSLRLFDLPYASEIIEAQCQLKVPASGNFQHLLLKMPEAERLVEIWLSKGNYPMVDVQMSLLEFANCHELFGHMIEHEYGISPDVQDILFTDPKNDDLLRKYVKYGSLDKLSDKAQERLLELNDEDAVVSAVKNGLLREKNIAKALEKGYARVIAHLSGTECMRGDFLPELCQDPDLLKFFLSEYNLGRRGQKKLLSLPNALQNLEIFLESDQKLLVTEDLFYREDGKELFNLVLKYDNDIDDDLLEWAEELGWIEQPS